MPDFQGAFQNACVFSSTARRRLLLLQRNKPVVNPPVLRKVDANLMHRIHPDKIQGILLRRPFIDFFRSENGKLDMGILFLEMGNHNLPGIPKFRCDDTAILRIFPQAIRKVVPIGNTDLTDSSIAKAKYSSFNLHAKPVVPEA